MPPPITTPALAGGGAIGQVPMLRAVLARAAIQSRKCGEVLLTLSMFVLQAEGSSRPKPYPVNICRLMPPATSDPLNDTRLGGVPVLVFERRAEHLTDSQKLASGLASEQEIDGCAVIEY